MALPPPPPLPQRDPSPKQIKAPTQQQVKQVNKVEKVRDELHNSIAKYRQLLKDTSLSANRGPKEKDAQMEVFSIMNNSAGELETLNVGEGFMALAITALNSVLYLRDEINTLRFQNFMLNKKIEELSLSVSKSVEIKTQEIATKE